MVTAEWIVAAAGLGVTGAAWTLFLRRTDKDDRAIDTPAEVRRVRIRGSYEPSEIHVPAGSPSRLIFRREETAPCSERVVFPDLGLSVMLTPFEDVQIDIPAENPGVHEFTCEMRMLHGRLVVDDDPAARPKAVTS